MKKILLAVCILSFAAGAQADFRRKLLKKENVTAAQNAVKAATLSDDDMARILGDEHRAGAFSCVMHCFSSGPALAEAALDLGFYLSMSGIAAFPRSDALRKIFAAAPLDRILVETDSPYLAPPPHRGRRCEPAYTALTAARGAETMGVSYETFCAATSANFDRLFRKAAR